MNKTQHLKDPGSAITHFIGMLMAICGAIPLLIKAAHEPGRVSLISLAVYAISLILLYAASTTYHTFDISAKVNKLCMEKDSGTVFRELKEDVSAYVELKLELLKLSTYERTGKVIAVLSYGLILLFLAFFAILFIFLALGFFLGDWLGSSGFGFGIVAVLYLLLIGIIIMNRDRISTKVLNEVIAAMTANDDKNNATNDEQPANPTGETDF